MTIKDLYRQKQPLFSLEVFPPKKESDSDIGALYGTLGQIAGLSPDFISVTCGAGGIGGKNNTIGIADYIQSRLTVPALAHLTCITATHSDLEAAVGEMSACNVGNVLALRGDIPPGGQLPASPGYRYAGELIRDLRKRKKDLCIGAACYPEGHIDCSEIDIDIEHLRRKEEAGADFLISQLFFENEIFYSFLERVRAAGITLPISAGVMPILSRSQIQRMIFLCGASLPSRIIKILHKYEHDPADLRAAGIEYAAAQASELAGLGADGVHIYTMNRPEIAEACAKALGKV
ncbi:MAG: methylenetetrahydrofolate reductase [Clostridiales bacterium]|jgi:methylenetetrahydrofolate reductase (NADPH)|nr:methylenetetrahydrofolate reductase [Clostridiales bacterium]